MSSCSHAALRRPRTPPGSRRDRCGAARSRSRPRTQLVPRRAAIASLRPARTAPRARSPARATRRALSSCTRGGAAPIDAVTGRHPRSAFRGRANSPACTRATARVNAMGSTPSAPVSRAIRTWRVATSSHASSSHSSDRDPARQPHPAELVGGGVVGSRNACRAARRARRRRRSPRCTGSRRRRGAGRPSAVAGAPVARARRRRPSPQAGPGGEAAGEDRGAERIEIVSPARARGPAARVVWRRRASAVERRFRASG